MSETTKGRKSLLLRGREGVIGRCAVCRAMNARLWGRRSPRLPWERLCVGCACDQGDGLEVRGQELAPPPLDPEVRRRRARNAAAVRDWKRRNPQRVTAHRQRQTERRRAGKINFFSRAAQRPPRATDGGGR